MNRKIFNTTVLSAALVVALGACRQEGAAPPVADAAAATTPAVQAEPAKPAIAVASGTYKLDPAHTMVLAMLPSSICVRRSPAACWMSLPTRVLPVNV